MNPSFVVDCSIAMAWCFAEEETPETARIQDRLIDETAIVPALWFLEVVNVLNIAIRRAGITDGQGAEFRRMLLCFGFHVDDLPAALAFAYLPGLCRKYGLTSYDAAYLELAIRRQLPLATLDKQLRQAAIAANVPLLNK